MKTRTVRAWSLLVALVVSACGGKAPSGPPVARGASSEVAALLLAKRPDGAIAVQAARTQGPAAKVVVTGRVAHMAPGFAVFTLVDEALPYCGQTDKADSCKTPWDYCCETKETRAANSLLVEARGADGKPLASPSLGDVRLLDQVTVTGSLAKDEHGNLVLIATGWSRDARPTLPDYVRWPQ